MKVKRQLVFLESEFVTTGENCPDEYSQSAVDIGIILRGSAHAVDVVDDDFSLDFDDFVQPAPANNIKAVCLDYLMKSGVMKPLVMDRKAVSQTHDAAFKQMKQLANEVDANSSEQALALAHKALDSLTNWRAEARKGCEVIITRPVASVVDEYAADDLEHESPIGGGAALNVAPGSLSNKTPLIAFRDKV